jgi:ribosomal protein S18 acetylase RimI-like enzyme
MSRPIVRIATADDRVVVDTFLEANNACLVARLGELIDARLHEALIAELDGQFAGVATLVQHGDEMEVLTLHAVDRGQGVGSALLAEAERIARSRNSRRLWLITTNDNLDALRFYQRRGLHLVRLHMGAVDRSRASLKPSIPATGEFSIPIRDELELELDLA